LRRRISPFGRNDSFESVRSYCHFEEAKRLRNLWIEYVNLARGYWKKIF
jgi:hypothetical protein